MDGKEESGRRILVVEDHGDSRLLLRRLLEHQGYGVVEAADGRQAVEAARRECPDLILMDLNLPGMDGVAATRLIRELKELCHVPVVAVTAHDTEEYRRSAILAGCNDYVTKPPDPELLLEKVRVLLEAGRAARLSASMSAALSAG
jgi:CheY-like chemotaxis protein